MAENEGLATLEEEEETKWHKLAYQDDVDKLRERIEKLEKKVYSDNQEG